MLFLTGFILCGLKVSALENLWTTLNT